MTSSARFDEGTRHEPGNALFETAWPTSDPEGLVTKFLAYESFRIKRELHLFEMVGTLQDRLGVLFWYLTDYVRDRGEAFSVPLSASQIAYLNRPAPLAGASPAVTIAFHNFVARERPAFLNLLDPAVLREALYWWCVEKAPSAKLETCLVTEEQVAVLRCEEQWIGEDYPFNAFMTLFFNSNRQLHSLDMNSSRDRAAYFHYLVLQGFTRPHLLRCLPQDRLRPLLGRSARIPTISDRVLAKLAGAEDASAETGHALRAMGLDLLEEVGWAPDLRSATGPTHSGQCFEPTSLCSSAVEPGIALIGPVRKTSGLGQATRMSLDVLKHIETKTPPTVRIFDLDNPAPIKPVPDDFAPYQHRRAINLIHLNAESIPLAFAYEPRAVFASSYNIGYFFWELNEIPKCHRLALDLLDEVWVSSEYNREIYARFTDKPVVNVGMAIEALPDVRPIDRPTLGLDPDSIVFLAAFDSFSFIERKNPIGVIEAFREAFPIGSEPVQLVLKTQNRGRVFDPYQIGLWKRIDRAVRRDPRIVVLNETLDYRELLGLKASCDCYVSLHRSEGWGFGMAEAMQLGLPVIATAYSGALEFCSPATAYLVDYDLISVREQEYIFVERGSVWADPSIVSAAAHMRAIVADPEAARTKGAAAARHIKKTFGIAAIGQRYRSRLDAIRSSFFVEEAGALPRSA